MRVLYAGCDLHGNSNLIGIVDGEGKRVFKKKLSNDLGVVRDALKPFQEDLVGIAVESTYNWYWLVDRLMEEGYRVHLANPSAIQRYSGMKHSVDRHDAFWLAEMLRLGILPEGYIYPKEDRPVRDLLRKRTHLVRLRTSSVPDFPAWVCDVCGKLEYDLKAVNRLSMILDPNAGRPTTKRRRTPPPPRPQTGAPRPIRDS